MTTTATYSNLSGTDNWAVWSVGSKNYNFVGGPLPLRTYILEFFQAVRPSEQVLDGRAIVFNWQTSLQPTLEEAKVIVPDVYEIGRSDGYLVLCCPGCWSIHVLASTIEVRLEHVGWRRHWDVLNQALTQALIVNSSTWEIVSVHAACVETDFGVALLAAESGSGKSTLTLGAAAAGAAVIADDRVFVSTTPPRELSTLGQSPSFRYRTSAILPALEPYERLTNIDPNADVSWQHRYKIAVDLEEAFGVTRRFTAGYPGLLVFLERNNTAGSGEWTAIDASEAAQRLRQAESIPLICPELEGLLDGLALCSEVWTFSYSFGDRRHFVRTVDRFLEGPGS